MTTYRGSKIQIYKYTNLWLVEAPSGQFGDFRNGYWTSVHLAFEEAVNYVIEMLRYGHWPGTYPVNLGEGVKR